MGIASATEDVNASDTMAVNENVEDEIAIPPMQEVSSESAHELVGDVEDSPTVHVEIIEEANMDYKSRDLVRVYDGDRLNGRVTIVIDDNDVYTKEFDGTQDEVYSFSIDDFKEVPSFGYHKVNASYQKNGVDKEYRQVQRVKFSYSFDLIIYDFDNSYELACGGEHYLVFWLPIGSNGTVNFEFNSKKHSAKVQNGEAFYDLDITGDKIGDYILEAQFIDASNKYPVDTLKVPIKIIPRVDSPSNVEVGEKEFITVTGDDNSNVTATLYKIEDNGKHSQVAKVSGKTQVKIPLQKILVKGTNYYYMMYRVNGIRYDLDFSIEGYVNENAKCSISKTGDKVTINFNGPKTNDEFDIYINQKYIKSVKARNGKFKCDLPKLPIGTHEIDIAHNSGYVFFKKFTVTVTEKDKVSLTFKKVNVKKSAKKLVLKATLKLNKKAKKGLKVTFKFNGKKYVAKTNKNGVAKVTIKKKVLKKLKKGKKVTYQATYLKDTVKYTVRVKK